MSAGRYTARIAELNPALNAFLDLTGEAETGLCWGVKSNIAVKGLPLTAGIDAYADHIVAEDAGVVQRIRAAGGTVLGTLNMHEGALGATTDNAAYGRTQNPWRHGITPGGSSGGSGSAVAAGLCDVALGSDTMGSVRIPAAYCGVQGHKPTTGMLPDGGVLALSPTLDHVGPLARDVETLWAAMAVLAKWDDDALAPASLDGLKIGLWLPDDAKSVQDDIRANLMTVLESATQQGASHTSFTPPVYDTDASRRAGLLISEVEAHAIHKQKLASDPNGFTDGFRKMMEWGARQSREKVDAAYAHVKTIHAAAADVWNDVDIVIAPTAPQTAFSFDEPAPANQANFTAWANFAALPATAIYTGLTKDGLPTSLQVIGPESADKRTLQIAAALEAIIGKPPMPPGYE